MQFFVISFSDLKIRPEQDHTCSDRIDIYTHIGGIDICFSRNIYICALYRDRVDFCRSVTGCECRCVELKVFMELKFGEEQKKILRSVICALFSIFPFALRMQIVDIESLQAYSGRFNIIFNELRLSCNGNSTLLLLLFLLLLSFYKNYFYKIGRAHV